MNLNAKDYISEQEFWNIIEQSEKGKNLEHILMPLTRQEIIGYVYWWIYFNKISYRQDLWAVAYTVLGGCSDDGFDYFRFWLVARGKEVFYEALENADSLCNEFLNLSDDEYPEAEDFDYAYINVFNQRFGEDSFYSDEECDFDYTRPEIVFTWNEDDEESIRNIIPKTFDKWWGNDIF